MHLPANGALLNAAAVMAGGRDGGPAAPGLPEAWQVRAEGFLPSPGPFTGAERGGATAARGR